MDALPFTKYVTELIQIVNANIVLANDIGKRVGLPVNEALKEFNQNFHKYIFNNVANDEFDVPSNATVIEENSRLRDEVEYINASSRRQKRDFIESSAILKDDIKKLETSLTLTQSDLVVCNDQLQQARENLAKSHKDLSLCDTTKAEYARELESLRQRLLDESDVYRRKIEASNAISEMHLSDIERENQEKMNDYIKTIAELRGRVHELNTRINENEETQAMLLDQSTGVDIDRIETMKRTLSLTKESLRQITEQYENMRNQVDIVNEEKTKVLEHMARVHQQYENLQRERDSERNDDSNKIEILRDEIRTNRKLMNETNKKYVEIQEQLDLERNEAIVEIEQLNDELKYCKDALRVNQKSLDETNQQCSEIHDRLDTERLELLQEIERLKDELRIKGDILSEADQRYIYINNSLDVEKRELLEEIKYLESKVQSANESLTNLQIHVDTLEQEKSNALEKISYFESIAKKDLESATVLVSLNDEKDELLRTLKVSEMELQKNEASMVMLNDRMMRLTDDKMKLAKLLRVNEETIHNLRVNHRRMYFCGIERFKNIIQTRIDDFISMIHIYNDEQLQTHLLHILSELSMDGSLIALLLPQKHAKSTHNFLMDELNDLNGKLGNIDIEPKRQVIGKFLRKKLDSLVSNIEEYYKSDEIENDYETDNHEKSISTEYSEDFEILLKHEMEKRDAEIKRLTDIIQNVPESRLNESMRAMSSLRRDQLVEILTRFSTKITRYDPDLSDKLSTHVSRLNQEFDDLFDYVDNILSVLIDINTLGFAKLSERFDIRTLKELSIDLRNMREKIESNSPNLQEEFYRLFDEIQQRVDLVDDSTDVEETTVTIESECLQYHELVKEVTAFRDNIWVAKNELLEHQISALRDVERCDDDTRAPSSESLNPIDYFIIVNQLELAKSSKMKLLDLFKTTIEHNQMKIDELTQRLHQVERHLAESKDENQLNDQTIASLRERLSYNKQLVKSLQDELTNKDIKINDLQSTKRQQETLKVQLDSSSGNVESLNAIIGSISLILKKYSELCNTCIDSKLLMGRINTLNADMPLKSAVSVLNSIAKTLSTFLEESRSIKGMKNFTLKRQRDDEDPEINEREAKLSRYRETEDDSIVTNNQRMYMQSV